MNSFEHVGYWWLPGREDQKVYGTLTFSSEAGFELLVYGSTSPAQSFGNELIPVIEGWVENNSRFRLLGCFYRGGPINGSGFSTVRFTSDLGYEYRSASLEQVLPNRFSKVHLRFTHLVEWLGGPRVREDYIRNGEDEIRGYQTTYVFPNETSIELGRAKLVVVHSFDRRGEITDRADFRPDASLKIEVEEELSLEEWQESYIRPLQDFLTLATNRSNLVTQLTFFSDNYEAQYPDDTPWNLPIKVYYSTYHTALEERPLYSHDFLLGRQDIKQELQLVLGNWFSLHKEFASVMALLFSVERAPRMYITNTFLNLAQALEVYHRQSRQFSNEAIPKAEYKSRKETIIESAPEKYSGWLKDKLSRNEPSLRQRIGELAEYVEGAFPSLVADTEILAKRATKTRNYLTHYSSKSKDVAEGIDLYWLCQTLSYILKACLLLELGLSKERTKELFQRNQDFSSVCIQAKCLYHSGAES